MNLLDTARAVLEGKAIDRPSSGEPLPAIYGPSGITRRMTQRGTKAHLSGFAGENAVDWVADAVDYWAGAASSATYHFEKDGTKLSTSTDEGEGPRVASSLEGLLRQPNPFQTYEDLVWLLVADLLLVGNGYWLKYQVGPDGRPLAIYRLHPAQITAIPGKRRPVDGYEYRVDGVPEPMELKPEEVIHFKLPNPSDPIYGAGIIQRGPRVYDQDLALVETMAQFFEQGAKLSGVLQSDRSVPEPLVKKIQRQFASMYAGSKNAYKVAVLERGLSFQSIQPTAAEAQFAELTELGAKRIFRMFGMHPALIDGDTARPGLLEEAQRNFDNKKMRPFLNKLQSIITSELTRAWGVDFKIDYEYVMPEKDRLTLAAVFSALPGVRVKEVREYVGLPPLGDEDDEVRLNMPGIGVEAGGTPMAATPGPQGGRPANPQNMGALPGRGDRQGTKPDPRYSRAQATKAMLAGELSVDDFVEEFGASASPKPLDEKAVSVALTARAVGVLERYRDASKPERADAVAEVAEEAIAVAPSKRAAQMRGRLLAHVAEGVRRGYTADQIIDGVEDENFAGVRNVIVEGATNGLTTA